MDRVLFVHDEVWGQAMRASSGHTQPHQNLGQPIKPISGGVREQVLSYSFLHHPYETLHLTIRAGITTRGLPNHDSKATELKGAALKLLSCICPEPLRLTKASQNITIQLIGHLGRSLGKQGDEFHPLREAVNDNQDINMAIQRWREVGNQINTPAFARCSRFVAGSQRLLCLKTLAFSHTSSTTCCSGNTVRPHARPPKHPSQLLIHSLTVFVSMLLVEVPN